MNVLIYDIETLLEMFFVGVYIPENDVYHEFEISKSKNEIDAFINFCDEYNDYYWVGYNNLRFDSQVVEWVLRKYEDWHDLPSLDITARIAQKAADVIHDANYDVFPEYREVELSLRQIDLFKINHYDNKNRRVSLKRLEFEMDYENIEEMPVHHTKVNMTPTDRYITRTYCKNDVMATYEFYKITIGECEHPLYKGNNQIELRQDIFEEFGIPCLNYSDSKIGDEMIKKFYIQEKGIEYSELPRKGFFRKTIDVKNCIAHYVKFVTPELQEFFQRTRKMSMGMNDEFMEEIKFYGNTYTFAKGGLHSVNTPKIFEADDEYEIIDWDVSSYYPAIIINNGKFPAHLGKEFLRGYKTMFDKRLELKPLAKKDKKIKGIVGALKLAVNSVYGKSSDVQSWIYDRQLTMFTTITGELSLMMLIEAYELAGIKVISANTDGVTIMIKICDKNKMEEINKWWCELTQYELERTDYSKIIFSTVNDYLAIKTDGEIKKKGDFLTDFELHKNKSARIVPIALEQYFVNNIPVSNTIRNHANLYDFCLRQKATKDFHYEGITISKEDPDEKYIQEKLKNEWHTSSWWDGNIYWVKNDEEQTDHFAGYSYDQARSIIISDWKKNIGQKTIYNKLIRYYVSNTGEKIFKVKNPECQTRAAAVMQIEAGEWVCKVCNFLPKSSKTDNVNFDYYIEKANRIINKVLTEGKKRNVVIIPNQLNLFE